MKETREALEYYQKSRIWFGDDVDVLNAICRARDDLLIVLGYAQVMKETNA